MLTALVADATFSRDYSQLRRPPDSMNYIYYSALVGVTEYCDERICLFLFVCVFVCENISGTVCPIFTKLFLRVTYGCCSDLLCRRRDKLSTSGFMSDVIFAHNERNRGMRIVLQRATPLHRRAQADTPAASYWLCQVLDDGRHRE